MEENKKKNLAPLIVAGVLGTALLVCIILLGILLVNRWKGNEQEQIKKKGTYTIKEIDTEVYRCIGDVYIVKDRGFYGMADLEGNCLVEPKYIKWVYSDRDWVSFEDAEEVTYVFDRQGNQLYEYVCNLGSMTTEQGQKFYRAVFYRQGMKIELDYNDADQYYGVHYYNAATGKLIFELTDEMKQDPSGNWDDFMIASLPDDTGRAVVIEGNGYQNKLYRITKNDYMVEEYWEEHVERRYFFFSSFDVWNRTNQRDGWLLTSILEERGEILDYSEEWKEILYDIYSRNYVPLPEEYQDGYGEFYQHSKGLYYGMAGESAYAYEDDQTDNMYYAICHGSKKMTEEIYQWINFGERYIIAGNNSFSHILDYEGNVLAEYIDVAFPFLNGKTLVCDENGAFFIDENLEKCSDYVMRDVDYCHPGYIRKGDKHYLVQWTE